MNNEKKQVLKEIIKSLHDGTSLEKARERFIKEFSDVSSQDIAQAEQQLINEGLAIEEVQRLCDVHSSLFKDSIKNDMPKPDIFIEQALLHLNQENKQISNLVQKLSIQNTEVSDDLKKLYEIIDLHYKKKEIVLFPYLEKHGVTSPPKVMWGVDDEIRDALKEIISKAKTDKPIKEELDACISRIKDMVFKEQSILLPMMIDTISHDEWHQIFPQLKDFNQETDKKMDYNQTSQSGTASLPVDFETDFITLPSGKLKLNELISMLNVLPFDLTFVDREDKVAYFTEGERIFPRERAVIGRSVYNCHPPKSQHVVRAIMQSFKDGTSDHEDFWIKMHGKYVLIRYYAVRDTQGKYLGTLEISQEISAIQSIKGEKRLLSQNEE
ncbi:MAG TPA: DUF438 domain-containing protein [Clostridia bacterium]